ncbi:MAG: hypothetical protein ABI051_01655 [Vicinamibacterales bacterium]
MRVAAALIGLAASAVMLLGSVPAAQTLKPLRAEWRDLENWAHYLEASRETELGLGLQVAGPTGITFVGFIGRLDIRDPTTPPQEVTLQVATGKTSNPNVIRRATVVLLADARTTKPLEFDLSPRLIVDDPAPGAVVENGIVHLRAAEFARLAAAETLTGNVFGFDIVFRADQLAAMQAHAERLHIAKPR